MSRYDNQELASGTRGLKDPAPAGFVERGEHLANLEGIRQSLSIGLSLWIAFGLADLVTDWFVHPGVLRYTLG